MEERQPSEKYIKGFNKGYVLQKHKPELALNLKHIKFPENELEFQNGLRDGSDQYQKEQKRDLVKSQYNKEKTKDIGMER